MLMKQKTAVVTTVKQIKQKVFVELAVLLQPEYQCESPARSIIQRSCDNRVTPEIQKTAYTKDRS